MRLAAIPLLVALRLLAFLWLSPSAFNRQLPSTPSALNNHRLTLQKLLHQNVLLQHKSQPPLSLSRLLFHLLPLPCPNKPLFLRLKRRNNLDRLPLSAPW